VKPATPSRPAARTAKALAAMLAATVLFAPAGGAASEVSTRASVTGGEVEGSITDGILSFRGIPFAAPPVGQLRWRPPQPVAPWNDALDARDFAPDCMQKADRSNPNVGIPPIRTDPREDCLYLNVVRPAAPRDKPLPVMVWFFGGGFSTGGTSPTLFQGEELAAQDVIFVSFNYRLGRLGFFGHPALSRDRPDEPKANYGFLDQIAALQWVKKNIAAFGGDPRNVTIFGESAGAGAVEAMMISPLAEGLFQKAIIQSGAPQVFTKRELRSDQPGRLSLEKFGLAFASSKGIAGTGKSALARLRALPATDLIDLSAGLPAERDYSRTPWGGPTMDGRVLPVVEGDYFRNGTFRAVPLLIGSNADDITASLGADEDRPLDYSLARFGADRDAALRAYDPGRTGNARLIRRRIVADDHMIETARFVGRAVEARAAPVYRYHFGYVTEALEGRWVYGAPHGSEIAYAFNNLARYYGPALSPRDAAVGKTLSAYWVNFARTGNPNGPGLPEWPRFRAAEDLILKVHANGAFGSGPDPLKARLDLAEKVAQAERNGREPVAGAPRWPRYEPQP